jgi:hypothetical protein
MILLRPYLMRLIQNEKRSLALVKIGNPFQFLKRRPTAPADYRLATHALKCLPGRGRVADDCPNIPAGSTAIHPTVYKSLLSKASVAVAGGMCSLVFPPEIASPRRRIVASSLASSLEAVIQDTFLRWLGTRC